MLLSECGLTWNVAFSCPWLQEPPGVAILAMGWNWIVFLEMRGLCRRSRIAFTWLWAWQPGECLGIIPDSSADILGISLRFCGRTLWCAQILSVETSSKLVLHAFLIGVWWKASKHWQCDIILFAPSSTSQPLWCICSAKLFEGGSSHWPCVLFPCTIVHKTDTCRKKLVAGINLGISYRRGAEKKLFGELLRA